jgi:tetratricopeptide (TPR) repeat protein
MPSIRTVNLVWERKVRGSYAVSRYALDNAGTTTLVLPRPLEPRAYDLTRLAADGAADIRATFSVETLIELEASAESDSVIGMTSDDLYLLHEGSKRRFMPERRLIFVDSALSMDGRMVVAGFSDVAGSSFALAVGDITGKIAWLREAIAPISAVAVSPEGGFIAQGAETGSIWLLDASRREHWLFEQDEPVHALACTRSGQYTAYGTAQGGVGLIDAEGSRKWEARLPGDVFSLAISADGGLCAALTRPFSDDGTARLFVLDAAGHTGWEYELERRLLGLALSPSGEFMATSGRDGTHTLYQVVFGQADAGDYSASSIAETLRKADQSHLDEDWSSAVHLLCTALDERPAEVTACERLLAIRQQQTEALVAEARERTDREDYSAAIEALERLRGIAPEEPDLYLLLREVRERWERQEIVRAEACLEESDFEGVGTILRGILAFAPHSLEARRRLAGLDARRARQADADAERLIAEQKLEAGLAELERAQQIAASADRAEKIRRAQIDMEFAEGMSAYNDKRYREAVFQFKKVLARDPRHADAKRHLNFAQRFDNDANEALNDRFSRLE